MPKTEPASRAALRRASLLNLAIAALVLGLRLLAFALTRSTAILADAVEPVFNIAAAAVTGFGVLASRQPADELHPFGHRKLEFVVVGFHGAMVLGGAMVVALAGVWQLYAAVPVQPTTPALVLFLVSILANAYLGRRLLEIGERHGSPALRAAGRHARFDVLIALAVVVNLVVVGLSQWHWLDPLVSLVMVVVIGHGAVRLLRRAALGLMDTAPSAVREEADRLLQSALDGELIGYHDLRCRDA
ncbi:MAG: cation diffusion facilitator family transporter, partial [Armatimonadetes bacterium]|nr:cation diffusion facilitator family transporter [Armatimonadota bacterium]